MAPYLSETLSSHRLQKPKSKAQVETIDATWTTTKPEPACDAYHVLEEPCRKGKEVKVIVIGAGASGLNFAHDISNNPLKIDLTIYDKNPEIGGTWYENRYPGCACDIPSVNYQFSWAPSPTWSSYYSTAPEILEYFKKVADDYNLRKYIRLSHRLVGAWWQEDIQQWRVRLQKGDNPHDVFEDKCHILINATGVLNKWKWPAIKGRESFQGQMLHSAAWDPSIPLEGKTVAVIGSGSSAVQIVPNIQQTVKELKCFIRSPSWVTAGFGQRFAGPNGQNFQYTPEQHEIFRTDPKKYLLYRKNIESELSSRFRFILNDSPEQREAMAFAQNDMRTRLAGKPSLAAAIVPTDFPVGCRRPTPGNGYLEALCQPNVTTHHSSITSITPTGIVTADGTHHACDVIICATGFDVSWRPSYPTIGRDNHSLSEDWKDSPTTYLSISVPHFPNYLIFNGPGGPYGHGSFLPITETLSRHFCSMLEKFSHERLASFEPSPAAVAEFTAHRREFLKRTAWSAPCRSWFKGGTVDGDVMMWPGSRIHFFEVMKSVRWEDYEITREGGGRGNRFWWFGNGFAEREFDGRDLCWYLGDLGDGDRQPEYRDEDVKEFIMK